MPRLDHDTELAEDLARRAARELEERLRAGEALTVESLQSSYPTLWNSTETVLELILVEYDLRLRLGQTPSREDYFARFPLWRERLEKLFGIHELVANETDNTLFDGGGAPGEHATRPDLSAAGYDVLDEIGRGGMGIVYKARQRTLNRIVALKVFRTVTWTTEEQRSRFQQEAEVLALLQHPHVVQIYEFGESRGLHYLALEFVDGLSLEEHVTSQHSLGHAGWAPRHAARFMAIVSRAIHFAHAQGIVHRDLKPANILLSRGPADGGQADTISTMEPADLQRLPTPKITDFGLARILNSDTLQTVTGAIIGTPSYMSPEQARGDKAIQPTTDIFSLGVILYELFTGRLPFQGATMGETLEQVRSIEPVPPRRLQPALPRDLETICLKCLHKEPAARYSTAAALADDLERFLEGKAILARPASIAEKSVKWVRRRPVVAALIAVIVLGALASLGIIFWQLGITSKALTDRTQALANEREEREHAEATLAARNIALARSYWTELRFDDARRLLQECPERFRGPEWNELEWACRAELRSIQIPTISRVQWRPDGRAIFAISRFKIHEIAADSGAIIAETRWSDQGRDPNQVLYSERDNKLHLFQTGYPPNHDQVEWVIYDCATREITRRTIALPIRIEGPNRIIVNPEITKLAFNDRLEARKNLAVIRMLELPSAKEIQPIGRIAESGAASALCFSADGARIARTYHLGSLLIAWDVQSGKRLASLPLPANTKASQVCFDPKGDRLAYETANGDARFVRVWHIAEKKEIQAWPAGNTYQRINFSADGRHIAWMGPNQIVLAEVETGRICGILRSQTTTVTDMAFSPDGARLTSIGGEMLRIFDIREPLAASKPRD